MLRTFFALVILGARLFAGIENPSCERLSEGVYRISFEGSGPVQIYADENPDKIMATKPLTTDASSPVEVHTDLKGRVYFHLKPKQGATRTVSTRQVPLTGAVNFRDLGGYRTANGRYVRWGRVYRSNNLASLTSADYQFLENIHLKVVCDVRTEYERTQQPTKWQGTEPKLLLAPIGSEEQIRAALPRSIRRMGLLHSPAWFRKRGGMSSLSRISPGSMRESFTGWRRAMFR